MITTGHLCSGYDGLGRALDLALPGGHRALWHAEVDDDASATLAKHDPDVRNVGDLLTAPWHLAPHVNLVTAGFPCQPVSGAGRQLADADPRWLWPGVINVIRTVRPDAVFLENVQNIVSIQGGAILRLILDDLRAAGYAARWTVAGACAVGAPHHRHRWFLLASRHATPGPTPEAVRVGTRAICGAPRSGGRYLLPSPTASDRFGAGRAGGLEGGDNLRTVVSLLPTPDAAEATRGGFLSPRAALKRIADPQRSSNLQDVIASLLPTPTVRDADGRGEGSQEFWDARDLKRSPPLGAAATLLPLAPDPARWGKYAEAVALWESIIGVPAPAPTERGKKGAPKLSPALPEWMMGLPAGHLTGHLTRSAAIKQAGNGVVPLQAAAAWRLLTAK